MSDYLKNSEEEAREYENRYRLLHIVLVLTCFLFLTRLWYLQIIKGGELRAYSEKNRVKETEIPAPRGLFLDREGRVLVDNLPGYEALILPQYVDNLKGTAKAVSKAIDRPWKTLISEVKKSRRENGPFRPVKVKENLNLDEVFDLKMLRLDHPGLNVNEAILRHYPLEKNGAQLFGYVAEISQKQIETYNKRFKSQYRFKQGDIIGKGGLEEVWEGDVHGKSGISFVEVDARGREAATETPSFLGFTPQDPQPGNNLVLTIDKDLQKAAFQAMQREDKYGKRVGGLVAMKNNGEILAWVNMPSFDPNEFSTGISPDYWSSLINDPFKPLRNKVIQDHYSPGSTFKPFVALAALEEGVIESDAKVYAPGKLRYGRRTYHDWNRSGHGKITVKTALEQSSNVFFYKMGISLGIDKMAKYASRLGIGKKTNIQLPNEVPGLMPTKEWKLETQGERWQPGENLSSAIGQGFVLTTALQMAVAYNTIGLEGKKYRPYIVKKVIDDNNNVLREFSPTLEEDISQEKEGKTHISKETFKVVKEGMRRVANGDRGSARWWRIPGVEMAGKTGTSQVRSFSADQIYEDCEDRPIQNRHHGWYIGYAPATKPEITVAVLTEHSCTSMAAVPVVRDIIRAYIEKHHPDWLNRQVRVEKLRHPRDVSGQDGNT